jgi:hypothetical protein
MNTTETSHAPLNLDDVDLKRLSSFRIPEGLLRMHQIRRVTDKEARVDCGITTVVVIFEVDPVGWTEKQVC